MQFAVKRLTMSDLTLFARQYRKSQEAARARGQGGSKQKGINLNADVFVDIVFPLARGNGEEAPLSDPGLVLRTRPKISDGAAAG